MRGKNILWLYLTAMLLSVMMVNVGISPPPTPLPEVSLEPTGRIPGPGALVQPGDLIPFTVNINNVEDLWAAQVTVKFAPFAAVVTPIDSVEGSFLSDGWTDGTRGTFFAPIYAGLPGTLTFIIMRTGEMPGPDPRVGASGSGTLATFNFLVVEAGEGPFEISESILLDSNGALIQHTPLLYTPDASGADDFALSYMLLYSRSLFDVYSARMQGVVKSPGDGSDITWTFLNAEFKSGQERTDPGDTKTVFKYINGLPPGSLNPTFASTVYEWNIVDKVYDSLYGVNPYNHYDVEWVATDWVITETAWGMEVDITIRDDVYWQDGRPFDAYDAKKSLETLRDYDSINWADSSNQLLDVIVTSATEFTVNASKAGLSLFYNYMDSAAVLPPQIWDRPWADSAAFTGYQPDAHAYGTDMAPTYSAGPWASSVPTNLFGTGPFIFQFYDWTNDWDDMWANRNYWLTQDDVATIMADMFWEVGDYTAKTTKPNLPDDGIVNVIDLTHTSFAFGNFLGDPDWDDAADFSGNDFVGMEDLSNTAYHLLWQKTYASP